MSTEFQKGADVKLKSGGPWMSAEELLPNGKWRCSWFDKLQLQTGEFEPSTLIKRTHAAAGSTPQRFAAGTGKVVLG